MQIIKYNASSKDDNRGGGTADRALNNKFQGMINQAVNGGSAQVGTAVDELWKKGNASGSLVPKDSSNITEGQDSMAIGTSTETMSQGELAIGVFNETNGDKMFTIGDGQDEGSRHNLFEVTKFGNVNTTGDIYTPKTVIGSQGVAGAQGSFNNIIGSQGDIANINSDLINTKNLNVTVKAIIKALQAEDITCDNLTVTKAAHFFKLIIDEIKASKGQIIITPANAKIDLVESKSGGWRCYFRASDADGNQIHNSFEANDQIVCQTFNAATGTSYNVSNTYYWRKCTGVSSTPVDKTIDGQLVPCHWFDLSSTDKDQYTNSTPSAGDECVMLGNRNDTSRQAAIIISAYNNAYLDNEIQSPAIVQYDGINDYNLKNHRLNVISKGLNSFRGTFTTTTGDDIETLIDNVDEKADGYEKTYLHIAWANSADGRTGFTKTQNGGDYLYIGFCANFTESDASLTYSDYRWSPLKGAQGYQGATGGNGTSVTITNKSVTYQKSTSGTTVPTGTWQTTTPVLQKGDYLWTRTIVYYSDGNSTTAYSVSYLGIDGTNGSSVTITSTSVKYAITTTSTKPADSSFTYTSMPSVGVGDYLWSMQKVTFSDGATIKNYTVSRIGADGTDGDDGLDGKTTHWAYATSADGSQNFSTTMFNGATYVGTYDDYVRADSTNYRSYTWTKLKGETGAQGDDGAQGPQGHQGNQGATGIGIASVTEYYLASSSSTGVTRTGTSGWSTSIPSMSTTNKYLWNYEDVKYTNNTHSYTDAAIIGANGSDGRGISAITEYYLASSSSTGVTRSTSGWTTSIQTVTSTKKYLWNYEKITYTSGDPSYTTPVIIGTYGDKGDKGDKGDQGANGTNGTSVTITSKSITYAVTSTSSQPADSSFTYNSVPSVGVGQYLWAKMQVTFSDGNTIKSYSVSRIGTDGSDGDDGLDGKTTHFAYSTSSDGSENFSTTIFNGATYIGTYDDYSRTDSTNYRSYTWTKLKGEQGPQGNNGANGTSVTITSKSVTYQRSTSGTTVPTGTWSTSIPSNMTKGYYLWTKTVVTYSDGQSTTAYSVAYWGLDGTDGSDGANGTNGTNGADAEFYTLVPVKEQAVVDRNGTLGVSATYNIVHVKGATTETIYATQSGYHVLLIPNNATQSHMYDICSYNTYSPSYTNTSYQTNYLNQSSKTLWLRAQLVYGSSHSPIEGVTSFIPVIMSASAGLDINEDLNNITSIVQGHTTSISTLTNNYSSISQDMRSITSRVSATEIGLAGAQGRIANAESSITQTANSLRTEVKNYTDQQIAAIDLSGAKTVLVDASSLSESYAYPVVIDFQSSNDPNWIRCQVFKTLDAARYGTCSYSNHNSGSISLLLDWYTKSSCWGTNTVNATWSTSDNTRYIEDYAVNWTNANSTTKIVGSIRQNTEVSREIVYVRGGSKYDVRTSFKNATITLYSSGYSWSSGSYSFSAPRISISSLVIPVPDKMRRSEIVQTADNIQLNVYNDLRTKTGIDVSAGQITLNANNTTIVGNLNITDASHGLTMYESGAQGAPRVNLQPQEVPSFSSLSASDRYEYLQYVPSSTWNRSSYDSSYSYFQFTPSFSNATGTTISLNRNDDVALSDIHLSTPSYLGTVYMKLVATCNGTSYTIFDYSYCTYKAENSYNNYHPYYFDYKHFTTPVTGSYTFTAYIRTSSSYSSISSGIFRICLLRGGVRQTFMGTNGFYAAQGGYKYLYASDDQIRLQNGLGGIRIKHYEAYGNAAYPPLIEVGMPFSGSGSTVKPVWIPFYNYTPLTDITGYQFKSKTIYYNNSSYTKYVYDVPASYEMNGILFLSANTLEGYDLFIRLPATSTFLDSDGNTGYLREGYTIPIMNNAGDNVYVVPYRSSANYDSNIIDANGNVNSYFQMAGDNNKFTNFIYIGNSYWFADKDT